MVLNGERVSTGIMRIFSRRMMEMAAQYGDVLKVPELCT